MQVQVQQEEIAIDAGQTEAPERQGFGLQGYRFMWAVGKVPSVRNSGGLALPEQPAEFGHVVHGIVGSQVPILNLGVQQVVEAVVVWEIFNRAV